MNFDEVPQRNVFGWIGIAAPVPAMMLLLFSAQWFQTALCPVSTLVAGHLIGLGLAIGAIFFGQGLLLVGLGSFAKTNPKLTSAKKERARFLAAIGGMLAAVSLFVYVDDLFSYYCATQNGIVVHPDPLAKPLSYKWADVQIVFTGCTSSRGGMSINFDLEMKDGRRIGLGGDSWSMLKPNYEQVAALLSSVPYTYDNQQVERCPLNLRQFFSMRPS